MPQKGASSAAPANEQTWADPATAGTTFKWGDDHWQYNWKTTGFAGGFTYRIGVLLDDGTTRTVVVALK